MRGRAGRERRRLDAWKALLALSAFVAVLLQIHELRSELEGRRICLAEARDRSRREADGRQEELETVLASCAAEVREARGALERGMCDVESERAEIRSLLEARTRELEGAILERLDGERGRLAFTRAEAETQKADLARLKSHLERDPELMKRRMIYPTVQLRGNGTVGSGVIIYSEVQPEASPEGRELYSTFLLTAYHVVLEVLGERMDSGTLNEVHVLLEGQSDTSQVFGAKLVLFDRPRDLALLRINSARKFRHVAELVGMDDFRSIDVFARAYAVGCPLGNRPLPTIGEISSKQKAVGDQVFWMLSAPTFYGNSGGGIYLADGYKLIGVSSMIYTYGKTHPAVVPHMGLFVPMDTIRRWLDAEGFSFLYEGRPIPRELLWKLAYVDLPDLPSSRPRAAADVSRSRKVAGEKNLDLPLGR